MFRLVARKLRRMLRSCTRQKESTRVATGMRPITITRAAKPLDTTIPNRISRSPRQIVNMQCRAAPSTAAPKEINRETHEHPGE